MVGFVLILTLCIFVGATYSKSEADFKKMFMDKGVECSKDYPLTVEEMTALHQHKMPNSDNAKCFVGCVFKKSNWINSSGMFDVEAADAMVEEVHADEVIKIDNAKKLFQTCKTVNDESVTDDTKGCQRATLLFSCLIENATKMGFKLP